MLRQIYTIADLIVIFSLLIDPFYSGTMAFLRILRGLWLIHSCHLLRDLRRDSAFFRGHEDAVIAAINLFVFVFVTTSVVHALFFGRDDGPVSYVDALYFTVATLTTTGFGDITLSTPGARCFRCSSWWSGWRCSCNWRGRAFGHRKSAIPVPIAGWGGTRSMRCIASIAAVC